MRGVNRIVLVGRVGRDPELKFGKKGTPWCSWSVATERFVRDGENWVDTTDWHRIVAFGKIAERSGERVHRGDLIGVEGVLTYESWTDEEGAQRTSTRVIADRVNVLSRRRSEATSDVADGEENPQDA